MIKWKKYMCVALSAAMMATLTTGCGDTSNDSTTTDKAEATTESDSDTLQDALAAEISADDSDDADKEETVYVLADADGTANDVTVSTWLKNADGSEGLNDKTNLSDIENVKGYEGYKDNGDGTITWAANGSDIYYQGKSSEKLPVDVKITYKLDGEEIEPSELAGKSGKVTIRFDYTNNTKQTVKAGSKNSEVISPFVMLSGMILPVDKFSNVQVENGKVISEGSNQIVVGYAVPGFKQCLQKGIDDSKIQTAIDNIDVPDYVEVSADVTDFELAMTMTVAASDLLDSDAEDAIDEVKDKADISDLSSSADKLGSSADQLEEGSGKITNGLETLKDGTYSLKNGAETLANGAASLKDYTSQLADGTSKISSAMDSLDAGITSIKTGSAALNDGAKTLASGAKTLDTSIGTLQTGADTLNSGVKELPGWICRRFQQCRSVKGRKFTRIWSKDSIRWITGSCKGASDIKTGVDTLITMMKGMPTQVVTQAEANVYSQLSGNITSEAGIDAAMAQIEQALPMGQAAYDAYVQQEGAYAQLIEQYNGLAQAKGALNAIDQIGESLTATITDEKTATQIKSLQDGAATLDTKMGELSAGLKSANDGAATLSAGVDKAYTGVKALASGTGDLAAGAKALKNGSKSLSDGAASLSKNMNTLYQGSLTLATGSGELKTAASTLDTSAGQIADGAKSLSEGADQLNSGSKTLDSGADKLVSGSKTLSDGMKQFNEDGIKKITKLFAGNYQEDIDYIEALFSDDAKYTSFGGAIDGTKSTVKFIYETAAIKADDK